MTHYKFDIKRGHYYAINEGEAPEENNSKDTETTDASVAKPVLKNLQTEDISQMEKNKQTKLQEAQKKIDNKTDIIIQVQNKIAQAENSETATQTDINNLQKQLLQATLDLENAKFEKAKIQNDCVKKILAAQLQLVESMIPSQVLPEKYKYLTESNIQNAKIHVDKLIKDDMQERIKGMVDFKKAFACSNLLYGKDKNGFYAVCVDQEDFNKLTNTLEEVGYLRDDILQCVMPQLFNRSELTK